MDGILPPSGSFRCWMSCDRDFLFIKRSNSSCLQHGIRGFGSFHHEIPSCEDSEDNCDKKGMDIFFCLQLIASSLSSLAVRIILRGLLPPV